MVSSDDKAQLPHTTVPFVESFPEYLRLSFVLSSNYLERKK